jgi:hypothetical protein
MLAHGHDAVAKSSWRHQSAARGDLEMHSRQAQLGMVLSAMAASLLLGACSISSVSDAFSTTPQLPTFEWNPYSRVTAAAPLTPKVTVTAADFVGAEGTCAGPSAESASAQAGPKGIALQMTECSLVQLLGVPEKLEIGTNDRGERTATMFYGRGERPGLYRFTTGQLTLIERIAEPSPAPKPQKPAPQAKPRRAVT